MYLNRREFIRAATGTAAVAAPPALVGAKALLHAQPPAPHGAKLHGRQTERVQHDREAEHVGADHHLQQLLRVRHGARTSPSILRQGVQAGAVVGGRRRRSAPSRRSVHLEDILKGETLEDRIYRLRCVEAWSMVIPWVGFPLADFIKRVQPTSKAKFVEFTRSPIRHADAGLRLASLDWPYIEGSADGRGDASADDSVRRSVRRGRCRIRTARRSVS